VWLTKTLPLPNMSRSLLAEGGVATAAPAFAIRHGLTA
jgi:hypothetical protein